MRKFRLKIIIATVFLYLLTAVWMWGIGTLTGATKCIYLRVNHRTSDRRAVCSLLSISILTGAAEELSYINESLSKLKRPSESTRKQIELDS